MKPIQEYSKDIQDVIRRKRQYVRQRGLKRFSIDEIVLMLEEQERQQGKINLGLFQGYMCTANKAQGGFDWDKTEQGYEFLVHSYNGRTSSLPDMLLHFSATDKGGIKYGLYVTIR